MREQIANSAMVDIWDGPSGHFWARNQEHFDKALHPYLEKLIAAAEIIETDAILDVGCGNGGTAIAAAQCAPKGFVDGIDLSSEMIQNARRSAGAARVSNVHFTRADAQTHRFMPLTYDLAISRFGAMFFAEPAAAFTNISAALKPGARLALIVWRPISENAYFAEMGRIYTPFAAVPPAPADAPGPFGLADPGRTRRILTEAGFVEIGIEPFDAPMWEGHTDLPP